MYVIDSEKRLSVRLCISRIKISAKIHRFLNVYPLSNGFDFSMIALFDISIFEGFILHFSDYHLAASLHILKEIKSEIKNKKINKIALRFIIYAYACKNELKMCKIFLILSRGRWNRTTVLLNTYRFEVCTPHQ